MILSGSASGIVGTILFPFLKNRWGLSLTTLCGSVIQVSSVTITVISFFLPGSPWHLLNWWLSNNSTGSTYPSLVAVVVFATGIVLSRAGRARHSVSSHGSHLRFDLSLSRSVDVRPGSHSDDPRISGHFGVWAVQRLPTMSSVVFRHDLSVARHRSPQK